MAELADALDSGSSDSNIMQVQFLLSAPEKRRFSAWKTVVFLFLVVLFFLCFNGAFGDYDDLCRDTFFANFPVLTACAAAHRSV